MTPIDPSGLHLLPLDDVLVHIQIKGKDLIVRGTVTDMLNPVHSSFGVTLLPHAANHAEATHIEIHPSQVRRLPGFPPHLDSALTGVWRQAHVEGVDTYLYDPSYDSHVSKKVGLTNVESELELIVERTCK